MIQNYKNHISIRLLIKQIFVGQGKEKCEEWFRNRTGKKHILLTYSCRSALYLAYSASEKKGTVITSPLTCTSAIDPILIAGNKIRFCDIKPDNLLMDTELVESAINSDCSFIQAIHHGGLMVDVDKLSQIANRHNLILIEDCGQAFYSSRKGKYSGTTGDIACFSMIKSGYGIGGGVLATDDADLFEKARSIQASWGKTSPVILIFRLIKALLENKRQYRFINSLFSKLMSIRSSGNRSYDPAVSVGRALRRPSNLFFRLFALQSQRFPYLHKCRRENAGNLINHLKKNNINVICEEDQENKGTFDKLFCILPESNVGYVSEKLNRSGIEARHLENKFGSYRQPRFDELDYLADADGLQLCKEYSDIHDRILNLPLHEKMGESDYRTITSELIRILNEENTY